MTETAVKSNTEPEIDEELLEEAIRQIGASSPNEALNVALRELVEDRRARRHAALNRVRQMSDEGAFDYSAIDEADR
jgi:Arc/MetJ family transcription regulator